MHEKVEVVLREEAAGNSKKALKSVQRCWRLKATEVTDEDLIAILRWVEARPDQAEWSVGETARAVRLVLAQDPERFPETGRHCEAIAVAHAAVVAAQADAATAEKARQMDEARAAAATRMLMTTTHDVPGREITAVITVVSGACVMSRNMLSDLGSDLTSAFGGALGGIEKAVESARRTAMGRLEEAASQYGADAVIAIDTSVQTVSDKAQLVMLTGTAVLLAD